MSRNFFNAVLSPLPSSGKTDQPFFTDVRAMVVSGVKATTSSPSMLHKRAVRRKHLRTILRRSGSGRTDASLVLAFPNLLTGSTATGLKP